MRIRHMKMCSRSTPAGGSRGRRSRLLAAGGAVGAERPPVPACTAPGPGRLVWAERGTAVGEVPRRRLDYRVAGGGAGRGRAGPRGDMAEPAPVRGAVDDAGPVATWNGLPVQRVRRWEPRPGIVCKQDCAPTPGRRRRGLGARVVVRLIWEKGVPWRNPGSRLWSVQFPCCSRPVLGSLNVPVFLGLTCRALLTWSFREAHLHQQMKHIFQQKLEEDWRQLPLGKDGKLNQFGWLS